jgi:hypothetical protein
MLLFRQMIGKGEVMQMVYAVIPGLRQDAARNDGMNLFCYPATKIVPGDDHA